MCARNCREFLKPVVCYLEEIKIRAIGKCFWQSLDLVEVEYQAAENWLLWKVICNFRYLVVICYELSEFSDGSDKLASKFSDIIESNV